VLFKKAATLLETSLVILFISILSVCLFKAGHGVYRIFVRMSESEYNKAYYENDPKGLLKRESDNMMWHRGFK
tara:strand:+ start:1705 stop:1923 length:219 start_codon:yes stop_codon:yes gene_type:complete